MSNLSVLRGVYADLRTYGVMIDRLLKRLERNKACPDARKLGRLLIDTGNHGFESRSVLDPLRCLILDGLLRSETGEQVTGLGQLGECLLNGPTDAETRKLVEAVAGGWKLEGRRWDTVRRW